jgi:hypothetical protein
MDFVTIDFRDLIDLAGLARRISTRLTIEFAKYPGRIRGAQAASCVDSEGLEGYLRRRQAPWGKGIF